MGLETAVKEEVKKKSRFTIIATVTIVSTGIVLYVSSRSFRRIVADVLGCVKTNSIFFDTAKEKSKQIVTSTEQENNGSIGECKGILKRANATWDTRAEVSGWKDIEGQDKFGELVEQIGKVMKIPEDQVTLMKKSVDTSSGFRKTYEFGCSMNDETGGNIRLHTGSYNVSKSTEDGRDSFNLDIALAYMELSNIQMLPQAAQNTILQYGQQAGCTSNNLDHLATADWKAFIEYESHKQLLNEMRP